MAFVLGQTVMGQYVIEALIGKGGMGQVYRARHDRLGRNVALKVLTPTNDAAIAARFELEARLLARVRHPNVVSVLDYGMVGDTPCIVMEYIKGESLEDRLHQRGALPIAQSLDLIAGVLAGLDAIHNASVLHRDLKPSNIHITLTDPEVVKLLDFGIATSLERTGPQGPRLTKDGVVVGTPAYMAPEQLLNGTLDVRCDVYTASLVLYEMITGALPWDEETAASALRRMGVPIARPTAPAGMPAVPPAIQDVILGALSRNPDQRPPTVRAFFEQLRRARGPVPKSPRVPALAAMATPSMPMPVGVGPLNEALWPTAEAARRVPQKPLRALLVVRLEAERLLRPEERQWLANQMPQGARVLTHGSEFWLAALPATDDRGAFEVLGMVIQRLISRLGPSTPLAWSSLTERFVVPPGGFPPGSTLPEPLRGLIEQLSAGATPG